jgi:hypothetical protein
MLYQILNHPDKDWASAASDPDALERLRKFLKTARWSSILTLIIWVVLVPVTASAVATEILSTEKMEKAQMIGALRVPILFFGLNLFAAAASMNRLTSINTELRILTALEGTNFKDNLKSPTHHEQTPLSR